MGKNFSIAALVCGILGIVGAFIPYFNYLTLVLGILGIVFGVKGRKLSEAGATGMATAGSVSYTHLDVYKRQGRGRSPASAVISPVRKSWGIYLKPV